MKIGEFKYNIDDIITTDGYLSFCNDNNICYIKTDFFTADLVLIQIDLLKLIGQFIDTLFRHKYPSYLR